MYTQFAAVPQGPQKNKSNTSCLACRRKKKKCDSVQPKCSRCRDSYGRDECIWPEGSSPPGPSTDAVANKKRPPESVVENGIDDVQSFTLSGLSIPNKLQETLPSLSPDAILLGVAAFQRKVLGSHPSYKQSIFALSLPLAVQHEPLMHAWASAILLALPDQSPQWQQQSVMYYDHAVRGLKGAILSESPIDEWKRATALLCHAIELLQPVQSPHLARSHLQGAHYMFQLTTQHPELPGSEHDALLFEAYIMRTAMNCLLQQDIHRELPYDYIRQLAAMHKRALDRLGMEVSAQHCPWMGASGLALIDSVYKVSWLNAHIPLSEAHFVEAVKVWESLPVIDGDTIQGSHTSRDNEDEVLRRVHLSACQIIAKQLLPVGYHTTFNIESAIDSAVNDLDMLTRPSSGDASLQWPLIVLGALADTQQQQVLCSSIAARFGPKVPQQTIDSILVFLAKARQIEDKRLRFRDDELLRSILL